MVKKRRSVMCRLLGRLHAGELSTSSLLKEENEGKKMKGRRRRRCHRSFSSSALRSTNALRPRLCLWARSSSMLCSNQPIHCVFARLLSLQGRQTSLGQALTWYIDENSMLAKQTKPWEGHQSLLSITPILQS